MRSLLTSSFAQTVSDNNEKLKILMYQVTDRVKAISEACIEAESDDAKERIDGFIRCVSHSLPYPNLIVILEPWSVVASK
jgi:maltose-binding protein MalE